MKKTPIVPKTVAFFLPSLNLGGAEKVSIALASALSNRGVSVVILTFSIEGTLRSSIPSYIEVINLNCGRIWNVPTALKNFYRMRPDIKTLIPCCWTLSVISCLIFAKSNLHVIPWEHGRPIISSNYKNVFYRCLVALAYRFSHSIVVVSDDIANLLIRSCFISRSKIFYIPNAIVPPKDLLFHDYKAQDRSIIWVGRFEREKNPLIMIDIFKHLLSIDESYELQMVGSGSLLNSAIQKATEANLSKRIFFPGYAENPYCYYRKANILAITSLTEGMPSTLIEALYLGLGVVSTRCSSTIENLLANYSHSALTSSAPDPLEFASAIMKIASLPPSSYPPTQITNPFLPKNVANSWLKLI